jgi:hypothetical protein
MKHVLEMTVVLLAGICATAQTPKPSVTNASHKPAAVKPIAVKPEKELFPFEVVSAKRINSVSGIAGRSAYWDKDSASTGLIIVLKRRHSDKSANMFSTDFSLHYGSEDASDEIPVSPAVGISHGISTPDETPSWVLGGVSRTWAKEGDAYFALLFEAPKKHEEFFLRYAVPLGDGIKVAAQ